MNISNLKSMTEEQIMIEIEKISIGGLSDGNLVLLFSILERYVNAKIANFLNLVREELRQRNIKRKIYTPPTPTKKGGYREEDY